MFDLALRAALLDGSIYQGIKDSPEAMFRAVFTVLVGATIFALGFSSLVQTGTEGGPAISLDFTFFVALSTIFTGWYVWTTIAWLLGTILFKGTAGYRDNMRALGICFGPLVIAILANVPRAGVALMFIGIIWALPAGTVAIKRTQEISWWKAGITSLVGWGWGLIVVPMLFLYTPLLTGIES